MAIAYWDPSLADDTGDGSLATPKQLMASASAVAGNSGEVRGIGQALTNKGNAAWTQDSTSVVFVADAALSAGDYIRPTTTAYGSQCPAYRVTSYNSGTYTATLTHAFRGTAGAAYDTEVVPAYALPSAQAAGNYTNQTYTFGWRNNSGSPVQDTYSAYAYAAGVPLTFGSSSTVRADGRLLVLGADANQQGLSASGSATLCRIIGTLDCSGYTSGNGSVASYSALVADTIISSYGSRTLSAQNGGALWARTVVLHNGAYPLQANGAAHLYVWDATLAGSTYWGNRSGDITVGTLHTRASSNVYFTSDTGGTVTVGYVDTAETVSQTAAGGAVVIFGGPASKWGIYTGGGVAAKVTGRGGTGYGLRINPSSAIIGTWVPLKTFVAAGSSVSLSFYCVYTGTNGDPPPCEVVLTTPDGLSIADGTFTPARSANTPGGSPDGWTDATQQTFNFSGTALQAGPVAVEIRVKDNAAGDAVLYVDDIGGTNFGTQNNTGSLDWGGTDIWIVDVATGGGGGLPFWHPEGGLGNM
jgi:hypothetical protein